jgi:biotin operon repressor
VLDVVAGLLSTRSRATVDDLAERCGLGRSTVGKALAELERQGAAVRTAGVPRNGRKQPDGWRASARATTSASARPRGPAVAPAAPSGGRLGRGELRASVLAYFQAHPGQEFGPTALGHALGRSSGAIGNAAETLTDAGEIARTSAAPRRYAYQP